MKANTRKIKFLESIPVVSILVDDNDLAKRCKFNFSYFVSQPQAGQEFSDWTHEELIDLCEKLKDFSREPLEHWFKVRSGMGGNNILSKYPCFPPHSKFTHPKNVPFQAIWTRFRLDRGTRLIGFTLPDEFRNVDHPCGHKFDCNTFYVVFLDKEHQFYPTK